MVDTTETTAVKDAPEVPCALESVQSALVEPDLAFIRKVGQQAGADFKRCIQCGTCAATCDLTPDVDPFPRKEMAWASWGRKDQLVADADVWLCHQCNDCTTRCPRGVRPGDVLAAVRNECVRHYAFPRFLARWASRPHYAPLLLAIPTVLFVLGLLARDYIAAALNITEETGSQIVYSYSRTLPHWLIISVFFAGGSLALFIITVSVNRFWRALRQADRERGLGRPVQGIWKSILVALKRILTHERFTECKTAHSRFLAHQTVFYGFLGLALVGVWVVTLRINPLIGDGLVYPFSFWSPWKLLANVGGLAVLFGCILMIRARLLHDWPGGKSSHADWGLIVTLLVVVLTGFLTEVLHYIRLEPHRHAVYFIHLTFVFAFLTYLPYSKFAHVFYRTTAMIYAEYTGRELRTPPPAEVEAPDTQPDAG